MPCGSLSSSPLNAPTQREGLLLGLETPMESVNGTPETTEEALSSLFQAIVLLLSRWNGLQMAVQNQWGGSDSLQKSQQLSADIFSWFSKSRAPVPVEDLESLLHESMLLTFNTEIEDGSIEVVAEQLMAIHEEYLHHQSS